MDVAALAGSVIAGRNEIASRDIQVSLLKKALVTETAMMSKLLAPMDLPLATEGRLGTRVNTYM